MSHETLNLPFQHQPGTLAIHLLNQCNLACKHCYIDSVSSLDKYLPKDLVIRSIGEVEHLGIGTIVLTGGEPLLYPSFSEILEFLSGYNSLEVIVSTNGTLIDQSMVKLMSDCGAKANVSIDGPASYHDKFRGSEGAFLKAVHGIRLMSNAGIQVSLVTTICKDNLKYVPWLTDWASEMGIKKIFIQPLLQLGRASKIAYKRLSERQIYDLYFLLSDLECNQDRGISFSIAYRSRDFLLKHPCAAYVCDGSKCHRKAEKEIKKIIIREDGIVLPEIETLNPRFSLGNLSEDNLINLVRKYFVSNYSDFDRLCRTVYASAVSNCESHFIPLDEIISVESWKPGSSLSAE
jgi:MoaA/NifB/PqqE/SkfB family radical SAM enzyme